MENTTDPYIGTGKHLSRARAEKSIKDFSTEEGRKVFIAGLFSDKYFECQKLLPYAEGFATFERDSKSLGNKKAFLLRPQNNDIRQITLMPKKPCRIQDAFDEYWANKVDVLYLDYYSHCNLNNEIPISRLIWRDKRKPFLLFLTVSQASLASTSRGTYAGCGTIGSIRDSIVTKGEMYYWKVKVEFADFYKNSNKRDMYYFGFKFTPRSNE